MFLWPVSAICTGVPPPMCTSSWKMGTIFTQIIFLCEFLFSLLVHVFYPGNTVWSLFSYAPTTADDIDTPALRCPSVGPQGAGAGRGRLEQLTEALSLCL